MGTMRKVGERWRAEVRRKGMYRSESFDTKSAARAWLSRVETEYAEGRRGAAKKTFGEALARYAREVSPKKKGERWEQIRLAKLGRDPIAELALAELGPEVFAGWRDRRLAEVSASSVARELALLHGVVSIARLEWRWIEGNPLEGVRRPKQGAHRTRVPTEAEIEALVAALGYQEGEGITRQTQRVAVAFLLACETGMRAGELLALTAEHCHARHVYLPTTKNGDPRDVPLTPKASALLAAVKPEVGRVFPMTSATLDVLFRRARLACKIENLHFHDSRHLFCTRMSKKVDVMTLAKIIGHRNLSQLLAYYNPSVDEIADRIAS